MENRAIPLEEKDGEEIEADLAPHKDMILEKIAKLNRLSLESLITILEEKTAVYNDSNEVISETMRALKLEVSRLLDRLAGKPED